MSLVSDNTSQILDKALSLRFERQQLLAGNIANVDTPNYQPVDLAFEGAFKAALDREDEVANNAPFSQTDKRHMSHQIVNPPRATEVMLRPDVTNSLDNNGVDLDREMARLTDNSTKYQTMVESARRRYAIITEVISTMSQG